ncbi:MAG: nucleoside deaminase [Alphaproteobacteria bacterium]|jgi:tRNA(Arg) A34 adenosine deaminase TadA
MISKRRLIVGAGALICVAGARPAGAALPPISQAQHEKFMRLAIEQAKRNPAIPSGSVIVKPDTGEVMARGVNNSAENPVMHGEMVCLLDYIRLNGNKGWGDKVIYTTGEPCSMCMSALVYADIGGVVFGSSLGGIGDRGIDNIAISAKAVVDAAPFYKGLLLGGVLANETDALFQACKKN